MMNNLTVKKPQTKNLKTLTGTNLHKEEKTIDIFPWDIDYLDILLKSASMDKSVIASKHGEVDAFLKAIGCEDYKFQSSASYQTKHGFRAYFGRQPGSSEQKLKLSFSGGAFVYRKARENVRKITNHLRSFYTDKLIDTKISRLDISTLAICDTPHDIIPPLVGGVINVSSMTYIPYYRDPTNPTRLTGITLKNSTFELSIYDKELDLKAKTQREDQNYNKYYMKYVSEAKKQGRELFRVELKIKNHEAYLSQFHRIFFKTPEKTDECLIDLIKKFQKFHQFRLIPSVKQSGDVLNRNNMATWEADEFTNMILCSSKNTGIKAFERGLEDKMDLEFKTRPKVNYTPSQAVEQFAKKIARINQNYSEEELNYYVEQFLAGYKTETQRIKQTEKESLISQSKYRLYLANNEEERELIKEDLFQKLQDLKIQRTFLKMEEPSEYYISEIREWVQLGLIAPKELITA